MLLIVSSSIKSDSTTNLIVFIPSTKSRVDKSTTKLVALALAITPASSSLTMTLMSTSPNWVANVELYSTFTVTVPVSPIT